MNLDGADRGLSRKHRRPIHQSGLLIICLFSVFTFSQSLVALVLLSSKSTLAPSSYQVFKSSNLHLNKSQSIHTCKQSTRNPMLTVNNIFYLLYLKNKKIKKKLMCCLNKGIEKKMLFLVNSKDKKKNNKIDTLHGQ